MGAVERQAPPGLEHRAPLCSLCSEETSYDEGWVCYHCDAYWSDDCEPGSWVNDDVEQCGGILQPFLKSQHENIRTTEYRCLRDVDHKGDHHADSFIYWKRQD